VNRELVPVMSRISATKWLRLRLPLRLEYWSYLPSNSPDIEVGPCFSSRYC
jgi:hypothetical protein